MTSLVDQDHRSKIYLNSSKMRDNVERLTSSLEKFQITDEMAFPPTLVYIPSYELLTFMINRAAGAKKDISGNYGFIF